MVILLILAGVLLTPAVVDLVRRADLRRMGLRNVARRFGETMLIVVGSALGTAIIAAALIVGDTFDHSIRDIARTELGEVDEVLRLNRSADLEGAVNTIRDADIAGVDGVVGMRSATAAIATSDLASRSVEPSARVSALDFDAARAFGSSASHGGLRDAGPTPTTSDIVINQEVAGELGAAQGDTVVLFAYGTSVELNVQAIIPRLGFGGFSDAYISPDFFRAAPAADDSVATLLISNDGAVFDSAEASRDVLDVATNALFVAAIAVDEVDRSKERLLDNAEEEGAEISSIFLVVGGFSVLAGVLLLVNLIVMLAEERKPNLGVLRAIGWKRTTLVRSFGAEGAIYAITAAVSGAILGIGVGWVIVKLTRGILQGANPDSDFELLLSIEPRSLFVAALTGLVISMGTVWATSWRISRMNIISAIRDLPEPRTQRSRIMATAVGTILVGLGVAALMLALSADQPYLAIPSIPLAIAGAALVARYFVSGNIVSAIAGAATVVWCAMFFEVMPTSMTDDVDEPFFLIFGVIAVAGGIAVATVAGPQLQRLLGIDDRPRVSAKLGMAYPVARAFRTAASLAMYSLIIFSLTFIAVIQAILANQGPAIAADNAANHDILVISNRASPIEPEALSSLEGVQTASTLLRGTAAWSGNFASFGTGSEFWRTTGLSEEMLTVGAPTLVERAPRFVDDAAVFAAVASDPTLTVVPDWFLGADDTGRQLLGSIATLNTDTGGRHDFEIVGVVGDDLVFAGPWVSADRLSELVPDAAASRFYVKAAEGVDESELAERIEAEFITNGTEAETFEARINGFIEADLGFFSLLSGYLLLGLVIGIGGLAVTLFRAVRERRRQIGMVRAMGMPASGVRGWFLTEAMFISVMGVVTGLGLGLLSAYLVLSKSTAFDGEQMPFAVPWVRLALVVAVPLVASALAAIVPAQRAMRLRPSEALRLAD